MLDLYSISFVALTVNKGEKKRMNKPTVGTVVKVVKSGNRYNAVDSDGNKYTSAIRTGMRKKAYNCLLYTSPSPRDRQKSRMPSSA